MIHESVNLSHKNIKLESTSDRIYLQFCPLYPQL